MQSLTTILLSSQFGEDVVVVAVVFTEPGQRLQLDGVELFVRDLVQVQGSHPAGWALLWRGPGWL